MGPLVTEASLRASSAALLKSADYDPSHDVLVDLRESAQFELAGSALSGFAGTFAKAGGEAVRDTRLAVVAGSDEQFGLARMYGAYRSGVSERVQVFRHPAEACAWLGVPPGLLD